MRKPTFRLQRVLEVKQKIRDLSKIELGKKSSEYNLEVAKIKKLQEEKKKAIDSNRTTSSIFDRVLLDNYIQSNEKMQKYQLMDVKKKEIPFQEALKDYLKKDREVKVLEKLKDKVLKDINLENQREEEKGIDEIVSYRLRRGWLWGLWDCFW